MSVFVDAFIEPAAQTDDILDTIGREERIAEDFFCLLTNTVYSSQPTCFQKVKTCRIRT